MPDVYKGLVTDTDLMLKVVVAESHWQHILWLRCSFQDLTKAPEFLFSTWNDFSLKLEWNWGSKHSFKVYEVFRCTVFLHSCAAEITNDFKHSEEPQSRCKRGFRGKSWSEFCLCHIQKLQMKQRRWFQILLGNDVLFAAQCSSPAKCSPVKTRSPERFYPMFCLL